MWRVTVCFFSDFSRFCLFGPDGGFRLSASFLDLSASFDDLSATPRFAPQFVRRTLFSFLLFSLSRELVLQILCACGCGGLSNSATFSFFQPLLVLIQPLFDFFSHF